MGESMKFEAGQVVRVVERDGNAIVYDVAVLVERTDGKMFWCVDARDSERRMRLSGLSDCHYFGVLSPAPRIGDTWTSGESVARVSADPNTAQLRIISEGEPFVGDVVAVARRLWDGGYRMVSRGSMPAIGAPVFAKSFDEAAEALRALREAFEKNSTWPVFTTIAEVDEGVHPTREAVEKFFAAEKKYLEAKQRAEPGAAKRILEMYERTQLKSSDAPIFVNGRTTDPIMPIGRLSDGTDSGVDADRAYREKVDAAVKTAVATGASVLEAADAIRRISHDGVPVRLSDIMERMFPRPHDGARRCDPPLDKSCAICATGDDLRRLAALDVLPELRAGMVVRREPCESLNRVAFGRVLDRHGTDVRIHWLGDSGPWPYARTEADQFLRDGRWRIVEPNVAPLASLANAVAWIFERPDVATSRRYVDLACAQLRGEPFACAIRVVLVAASDGALAPYQIASLIDGARAHERHRSDVAPARRELTESQLTACCTAARDVSEWWTENLSRVYERVRRAR